MPKQNGANGEHVVTMREVAKAAGVSIKTVSNVVKDRKSTRLNSSH